MPSPWRLICSPITRWPKVSQQHLGVGRVIAEVGDNESIVAMAPIDRRQRARPRTAKQVLRQFFGLANPEQPSPIRRVAADDGG